MEQINIESLAKRIREQRAGIGVREAARQVGISSATLSRVENSKIPDLETFKRICAWLGDDPSMYLGLKPTTGVATKAQVHFKKETAIRPDSAKALSEMILLAHQALLKEEQP